MGLDEGLGRSISSLPSSLPFHNRCGDLSFVYNPQDTHRPIYCLLLQAVSQAGPVASLSLPTPLRCKTLARCMHRRDGGREGEGFFPPSSARSLKVGSERASDGAAWRPQATSSLGMHISLAPVLRPSVISHVRRAECHLDCSRTHVRNHAGLG